MQESDLRGYFHFFPQAEFILDLQKQLSLVNGNPKTESKGLTDDGSIPALTVSEKVSNSALNGI